MSEIFSIEIAESWVVTKLPVPPKLLADPLFEKTVDRVATLAKVKGRTALDTTTKLKELAKLASEKKLKAVGTDEQRWLIKALVHQAFPDKPSAPGAHWLSINVKSLRFDSGMISQNDTYGFTSFVLRVLADAPDKASNAIRKKLGARLDEATFKGATSDVWATTLVSRKKIGSDGGQPLFEANLSTVLPAELTAHVKQGQRYPSWAFWYQPKIKVR